MKTKSFQAVGDMNSLNAMFRRQTSRGQTN